MSRNSETLADFIAYCEAHPEERFWQALRSWSGYQYILAVGPLAHDTFSWEGKEP